MVGRGKLCFQDSGPHASAITVYGGTQPMVTNSTVATQVPLAVRGRVSS